MSDSSETPWAVLPGSSVHGIFQARILEWAAISFSRGSSQPRDRTRVSCRVSCRQILYHQRRWGSPDRAFQPSARQPPSVFSASITAAPCSALFTLVIEKGLQFPTNPSSVQCLRVFVHGDISAWNSLHTFLHLGNTSPFFLIYFFFTEVPLVYNIM